jgi:branched-chain amino acid transport system substrate-binding protein
MHKRTLFLTLCAFVASLALALLVVACGSTTNQVGDGATTVPSDKVAATLSTASPETTVAPAFDGQIEIGGICSLTGVAAMGGAELQWAEERAVSDINAKGGVAVGGKKMQLKLTLLDDKSDPNGAAAAMEQLIKVKGLKLILGSTPSPLNMAALQVAEKYDVLFHTTTIFNEWIRAENFQWVTDLFFPATQVSDVPFGMVGTMPKTEQPTRWAVLTEDNADGQAIAGGVKASAEHRSAELVVSDTFTPGTNDFSSVILRLKQAQIDALVCYISPADGITFAKQMKEQNFAPRFVTGWKGFWPTEFMKGLGSDSDYFCHDGFWSEDFPYPGANELGEAYKDAHDGIDSVSIGLPYASIQVLAKAIERAGTVDPGAVRKQIVNGKFDGTVLGDLQYDAKGVADIASIGLQWKDGKRVVIYPESLATGKLEWFVPWGERK